MSASFQQVNIGDDVPLKHILLHRTHPVRTESNFNVNDTRSARSLDNLFIIRRCSVWRQLVLVLMRHVRAMTVNKRYRTTFSIRHFQSQMSLSRADRPPAGPFTPRETPTKTEKKNAEGVGGGGVSAPDCWTRS